MPGTDSSHEALRTTNPTPIAKLTPDLSDPKTRVVHGDVTITWPFSIVTKSIAFIVAERDFRLRRDKGQVRVKFHGSAAKAIAGASVGGGDEVRLSLEGARWEKNESNTQIGGSTLEWQLEFTNRLSLLIRRVNSEEENVIDIDSQNPEADATNGQVDDSTSLTEQPSDSQLAIPLPGSPDVSISAKRPASSFLEPQEFASPAFIKRARVSYGSLFEGGLDIFDEDVDRKSKKKKRSRFSLPANAWKYSSRSPSPEAGSEPEPQPEVTINELNSVVNRGDDGDRTDNPAPKAQETPLSTPLRPTMVDGGCQTVESDLTPMRSVQVSAEARPASFAFPFGTPTPLPRTKPIEGENVVLDHSLQLQDSSSENHHAPNELSTGFLDHSPAHGDTALSFGFPTSQPLSYPPPPNPFSASRGEEALQGPSHDFHVPDAYPASFLDNSPPPTNNVDSHAAIPSHNPHSEPEGPEQVRASFNPGAHLFAPYQDVHQPPHDAWAAGVTHAPFPPTIASHDVDHPMEIPSSPEKEHGGSEDIPSSPSERTGLTSIPPHFRREQPPDINISDIPEEEDDEIEDGSSEENHYQDGGDRPGDDYDLRNYDRAHADDDEIDESEEENEPDPRNPDAQIIDPEQDADSEELEDDDELERDDDGVDYVSQSEDGEGEEGEQPEYGEFEGDTEGEYYSGEEDYDEDEYGDETEGSDEEEHEVSPRPTAPSQPVFISLLSDSEDEDEPEPAPSLAVETEAKPESEDAAKNDSEIDEAPEEPTEQGKAENQEPTSTTERENPEEPELPKEPEQANELEESMQPKELEQSKETEQLDESGHLRESEEVKELEQAREPVQAEEPEKSQEPQRSEKPEETENSEPPKEAEEAVKPTLTSEPTVDEPAVTESTSPNEAGFPSVVETTQSLTSEVVAVESLEVVAADGMDVDEKPSGSTMLSTTAEDIDSTETAHIDATDKQETTVQRPLDELRHVSEQRDLDGQQDGEPESSAVGAQSPDRTLKVASVTVDIHVEKTNHLEVIEHLEDAHPMAGDHVNLTDAMDVDETNDTGNERDGDSTSPADQEIVDTNKDVTQVRGAIPEAAPTHINDDQDGLNQVPTSAGSPTTPGNGVKVSPLPSAPAQEIEPIQEGADPNMETQGQGHVDSPDATMQDASQAEVTAGSRLSQAANMLETGNGETAGQTNGPQQPSAGGQMSPPATQVSHTQPSQQNSEPTLSQDTSMFLDQAHYEHLPTPGETQVEDVEMAETEHFTEQRHDQADEDDLSPEDQIMAEIQQHSPIKYDTKQAQHLHPAVSSPAASPRPGPGLTETTDDAESNDNAPKSDVVITAKSLRSRGHKSTKSKSSDTSHADPSISLAKAPSSPRRTGDDVKARSTPITLRITRSKADSADPSIQLARATSTHAKGKRRERDEAGEVKNSPPAKPRISRSRVDHADPSVQLAKGTPVSTRQSRRPVTPERPSRETRSSSRGMAPRANTPDTAASVRSVLHSPSVAGSSAAPEDETVGAVKLQLLKSLRTGLPDFLPLKTLRNSLNQATDVLAVATTTPAQPHRPKHGPRDYMLTLSLTDPSVGPGVVAVAHIFRPHQSSLPVVKTGDVVLLRRVQVVSMKGRGFGVRAGDASAWAVFENRDEGMLPQIKGPPVEVVENEIEYVEGLRRWWNLLDAKAMDKMERANRKISEAGKEDVK